MLHHRTLMDDIRKLVLCVKAHLIQLCADLRLPLLQPSNVADSDDHAFVIILDHHRGKIHRNVHIPGPVDLIVQMLLFPACLQIIAGHKRKLLLESLSGHRAPVWEYPSHIGVGYPYALPIIHKYKTVRYIFSQQS